MSKLEQAARQALEALVDHGTAYLHHEVHYSEAITALREALAEQAEQESVAFQIICPRCKVDRVTTQCPNRGSVSDCPMTATAQNAAPVRTKDLSDEELWEAAKTAKSNDLTDAFRAVITADREKNK